MEAEETLIRTLSQLLSRLLRTPESDGVVPAAAAAAAAAVVTPAIVEDRCVKNSFFWFGGRKVSKHSVGEREQTYSNLVRKSLKDLPDVMGTDTNNEIVSSVNIKGVPPMLELVRQISATTGVPGTSEKISRAYIEQELCVFACVREAEV